ncbi:MAG: gfo/Idh/MocA family oxidoreductase, partial [Candidatus Omnitrophica bacterium]|nr:gfo/Idh/MocA family oxidoreductase [Candidatus Omnitrophota bacterium]
FPKNFIAHIHCNWLSPLKIRQTLICGSKKMIVYNDLDPIESVKIYDYRVLPKFDKRKILVDYRTGHIHSPWVDRSEALGFVVRDFAESIRKNRKPVSDGRFGLKIVRILEACDRSLKAGGKFVRL